MAGYELRAAAGDAARTGGSFELEAYDAEHDLTVEAARRDRARFLGEALELAEA
jgi:hypothetical protein